MRILPIQLSQSGESPQSPINQMRLICKNGLIWILKTHIVETPKAKREREGVLYFERTGAYSGSITIERNNGESLWRCAECPYTNHRPGAIRGPLTYVHNRGKAKDVHFPYRHKKKMIWGGLNDTSSVTDGNREQ